MTTSRWGRRNPYRAWRASPCPACREGRGVGDDTRQDGHCQGYSRLARTSRHVERIKPRLVVLDTLADVFAGNENIRPEARQFIGLLRGLALNCDLAVVLIAHPSLTGMATGTETSGSTAWSNSVRSRLYLEGVKDAGGSELDGNLRTLTVKKSNYGPPGRQLDLRWDFGRFVPIKPSALDKIARNDKAERVFLDLLAAFSAQGRDVSPNVSNTYAPSVFEKHPDAEGVSKKEFATAMGRLLSTNRIRSDTAGPPSRRYSKLVVVPP